MSQAPAAPRRRPGLRSGFRRRRLRAWMLLGLALEALGCARLPGMGRQPAITENELRQALVSFSSRFAGVVSNAADDIREATSDPGIRRRSLLWEMQLVPLVQDAAFLPDPQEAFVSVNGIVVMQRRYLTEGDGAHVFGPQQPIAVGAAWQLEEEFYELARLFLSEAEVARLRQDVERYPASRVISGRDFTIAGMQRQTREVRESGRFDWIIEIPMSPFRALEGVGSGAAAIHDFNETALRFSRIVEGLPQQLRWQTSLLLYDVETRESVIETLSALDSFAESARRLASVAESLPADLETTLGGSAEVLEEARATLLVAQGMVEPLRATAEQVSLAGASWGALFERDAEPEPHARPFDIREVESTARGIGEAAVELRSLTEELRLLLESPELGGVAGAVSSAEAGGRSVVDHAAWRGLQLLLVGFALLAAYRLLASRLASR